jgi:hypothetical protein
MSTVTMDEMQRCYYEINPRPHSEKAYQRGDASPPIAESPVIVGGDRPRIAALTGAGEDQVGDLEAGERRVDRRRRVDAGGEVAAERRAVDDDVGPALARARKPGRERGRAPLDRGLIDVGPLRREVSCDRRRQGVVHGASIR